jgi:uncharacterized protein DUF4304
MDGALVTAQDVYRDMLRTHNAPRLRGLGFMGSGATYVLPDDARWLLLGFQQRNIRADCVRFTVNLSVADKETWDSARLAFSWLGEDPGPTPASRGIRLASGSGISCHRWAMMGRRARARLSQHGFSEPSRISPSRGSGPALLDGRNW